MVFDARWTGRGRAAGILAQRLNDGCPISGCSNAFRKATGGAVGAVGPVGQRGLSAYANGWKALFVARALNSPQFGM